MTYNLNRFIETQHECYTEVLKELRAGKKRTHWIWYIFPQQKGLGSSYNSQYYGLDGIEEARAYLSNSILGNRFVITSYSIHYTKLYDLPTHHPMQQ